MAWKHRQPTHLSNESFKLNISLPFTHTHTHTHTNNEQGQHEGSQQTDGGDNKGGHSHLTADPTLACSSRSGRASLPRWWWGRRGRLAPSSSRASPWRWGERTARPPVPLPPPPGRCGAGWRPPTTRSGTVCCSCSPGESRAALGKEIWGQG